jgi:hypothetical protein
MTRHKFTTAHEKTKKTQIPAIRLLFLGQFNHLGGIFIVISRSSHRLMHKTALQTLELS